MKKRIILDVDTGIDDALAITYAAKSSELDILGVTTCHGNVSVENATNNTLHVLDMLDMNIPVAKGASQPIFHQMLKEYSTHFHGENGLANQVNDNPNKQALDIHATQFMIDNIKRYPNELTLICLGSLTNLALVIMQEPDIVSLIKEVIIMGGALTVPGNHQMHAEANIYADPEAADLVFKSGAEITLVGLDVTMQTVLHMQEVEKWRMLNTPLTNFLADITEFYIKEGYNTFYNDQDYCALHDPLAVAVALDSSLVTIKPMVVYVDLEGIYSYGRTVPDLRKRNKEKPNINACVSVEVERFLDQFLNTITR